MSEIKANLHALPATQVNHGQWSNSTSARPAGWLNVLDAHRDGDDDRSHHDPFDSTLVGYHCGPNSFTLAP